MSNKNTSKTTRSRDNIRQPGRYHDDDYNHSSSSNSKKSKINKTNPPPENFYCYECGVLIDNINHFHYVYEDDYTDGEIDVCGTCFDNLIKSKHNPSTPPTTSTNNSAATGIVPNPLLTDTNNETLGAPKIRLVFFNPPALVSNNDNRTPSSVNDDDKAKDGRKDGKKKDSKISNPLFKNPNVARNLFSATSNGQKCSTNHDDDNSLLFFQHILNQLHNIDNTSTSGNANKDRADGADGVDGADTEEEDDTPLEFEWLGDNIKTIDDLITIGKSFDSKKRKRYNLNLKQLNKLVAPLEELQAMVGMTDVKKIIFDQLIYYLQNLDDKNVDMLHTVIVGPPGVGKTQLTHIIAKIYNRLGFLKTDKVICAKRDDLIGEYIGQTAPKTRKVLERALGGVLLLDEIYSLAPTSDKDFAREAIDMINMYLSEHAHDLVCVVAGYKKPTYEKFFSQNEGLARRFTHHFEIKGYTHDELALIFKKYLESQKWSIAANIEEIGEIIKSHMDIFPNFGGDMTTLFACCKKAHSRRLLAISTEAELDATKKKIQKYDIIEAVGIYKEIKEKHSSVDEEDKAKYMHMYV